MGGLIDPPMMGAAAFLMAEFLGVPYWDVVLRGFALGAVYYISLALSVYLLCVRLLLSLLTLPLSFPGVIVGFFVILAGGRQGVLADLSIAIVSRDSTSKRPGTSTLRMACCTTSRSSGRRTLS